MLCTTDNKYKILFDIIINFYLIYIYISFLILLCYLQIGLPSCLFPSGFPTNTLYACTLPIHASCPSHLLILDVITQIMNSEQYKSWSSSLCSLLQYPVTLSFLGPNIFLNTIFWDWWSAKLCFFPPLLLQTVCVCSLWRFQRVEICFVLPCGVTCPLLKVSTTSPFRVVWSPFLVKTDVVLLLSVVSFTWCCCCAYCMCLHRALDCCNSANTAIFVTWGEQRVWRLRVVCSIKTRDMFQ